MDHAGKWNSDSEKREMNPEVLHEDIRLMKPDGIIAGLSTF